jgi:methyl-accepting chemotaxis protein
MLVDLADIETNLAKIKMQGGGYALIMDMHGTLLSHPDWKGRNMMDAVDAYSGVPFVRQIIDSIQQARTQNRQEGLEGLVSYHIKELDDTRIISRMMSYRFIPEMNWIIGVVADLDQLEAPLRMIRYTNIIAMVVSLLLALLVVVWAVRPMTRSVSKLVAAVEQIDQGHLHTPLPSLGDDEIGRLSLAFSRMTERLALYTENLEQVVAERTAELEEANFKLAALSVTDGLTGIANRRHFDEILTGEWARAKRTHQPLALVMIDVDLFKKYNDSYGHQTGDECLKKVARILQAHT